MGFFFVGMFAREAKFQINIYPCPDLLFMMQIYYFYFDQKL